MTIYSFFLSIGSYNVVITTGQLNSIIYFISINKSKETFLFAQYFVKQTVSAATQKNLFLRFPLQELSVYRTE